MKVISTHFVLHIAKQFCVGEQNRVLKKAYLLEDGTAIIETEGDRITFDHISAEEFTKLEQNGLNTKTTTNLLND